VLLLRLKVASRRWSKTAAMRETYTDGSYLFFTYSSSPQELLQFIQMYMNEFDRGKRERERERERKRERGEKTETKTKTKNQKPKKQKNKGWKRRGKRE